MPEARLAWHPDDSHGKHCDESDGGPNEAIEQVIHFPVMEQSNHSTDVRASETAMPLAANALHLVTRTQAAIKGLALMVVDAREGVHSMDKSPICPRAALCGLQHHLLLLPHPQFIGHSSQCPPAMP